MRFGGVCVGVFVDRIAREVTIQTIIIEEILMHRKQLIINGKDPHLKQLDREWQLLSIGNRNATRILVRTINKLFADMSLQKPLRNISLAIQAIALDFIFLNQLI
jgi:hypothetical protein